MTMEESDKWLAMVSRCGKVGIADVLGNGKAQTHEEEKKTWREKNILYIKEFKKNHEAKRRNTMWFQNLCNLYPKYLPIFPMAKEEKWRWEVEKVIIGIQEVLY